MKIVKHRLIGDDGKALPFQPSPNHSGAIKPRFLVMHYTAGRSAPSACAWLCNPRAKASAHVVVGRDGKVTQLVPFNVKAWHAGKSAWDVDGKHLVDMNAYSLGIELDNPGRLTRHGGRWRSLALGTDYPDSQVIEAVHKHETKPFGWAIYPSAQLETAFELASLVVEQYGLQDVMGHEDVAPLRKSDPGPAFPMESFRGRLFGREEGGEPDRFVVSVALNLRQGAGTAYPTLIPKPLPKGTRVQVLAADGSWRKVDVLDAIDGANDLQGWVHGRYLQAAA